MCVRVYVYARVSLLLSAAIRVLVLMLVLMLLLGFELTRTHYQTLIDEEVRAGNLQAHHRKITFYSWLEGVPSRLTTKREMEPLEQKIDLRGE